MTYLFLYVVAIVSIWWVYQVGWLEALKKILAILIPSILIILFNIKAGRLLFKNPIVGIISVLPTAILIYRSSQPLVIGINNWLSRQNNNDVDLQEVVDTEVISKEDA